MTLSRMRRHGAQVVSSAVWKAKFLGHSGGPELGYRTVMWTLIPGDWREKPAEWLISRMQPITQHAQRAWQTAPAHPSTVAAPAISSAFTTARIAK